MGLSSFQLKCIAILTMVIDHTGAVLFPQCLVLRYIGRISFPIFCFLLAEGFFHTRDVKKYMMRLGIFAVISEIPYDLAFQGEFLEFTHQNVFFTLTLGVLMMYAVERCAEGPAKTVVILLAMWAADMLRTDYSFKGILLISVYYFLREQRAAKAVFGALWNPLWSETQAYGAMASIPIALYNGEKGRSMKYFFYGFYPVHLLILYSVEILMEL